MRIQKRRGDEFQQELRGWITIAPPFVQLDQPKNERSRAAWRECHVEANRLDLECHELQQAVDEDEWHLAPLWKKYDLLDHSVAEQARKLDLLKTDRALRVQELNRLCSSHVAHIEEMTLFRVERNLSLRDRDAQLNHLVDFVIGLPPS